MSELPKKIPKTERPGPETDSSLERLEESTLDKQASSAAYRAAHEHSEHLKALNTRIGVLQTKLDRREDELNAAKPRVAELEQAKKTSRLGVVVDALGIGGGVILLSIASFSPDGCAKYACFAAGISASSLALVAKVLFATFGWPK